MTAKTPRIRVRKSTTFHGRTAGLSGAGVAVAVMTGSGRLGGSVESWVNPYAALKTGPAGAPVLVGRSVRAMGPSQARIGALGTGRPGDSATADHLQMLRPRNGCVDVVQPSHGSVAGVQRWTELCCPKGRIATSEGLGTLVSVNLSTGREMPTRPSRTGCASWSPQMNQAASG